MIGLLSAVAFWQLLRIREQSQVRFAVEQEAYGLRIEIKDRIDPNIHALVRMAKRWELREGTPREEWESDAAQHLADQFGTRAIVRVDSSNIARWIVPLERQETYTGLNIASDER